METYDDAAGPRLRSRRLGRAGWTGAGVLALIGLAALLAPLISPYDPRALTGSPFEHPSAAHWLGTNDIGQDILSELIWGARVSLAIGIIAAAGSAFIGTSVGVAAGYFKGAPDALLMRSVDVVLVIPFLPLMIVLAAYLGSSVVTLTFVMTALLWAEPARVIRSAVLGQREREFVTAARALGAGEVRILRTCIVPGVLSIVLSQFITLASAAILIEASLAFLGLGDPVQKSWGSVLYYAQARGAFLTGAWAWWVVPPGLLIAATVMGFALLGFDLERTLNPRLRGR